jgi:hypothetical protein
MEYHDANVDLSPRSSRDQQQVGKEEFLALLIGSHLNLPSPSALCREDHTGEILLD